MVACAMLAAFFVLRADLERRGLASSSKKDAATSAGAASPKSANAEAAKRLAHAAQAIERVLGGLGRESDD